jgi:hypothetical protein
MQLYEALAKRVAAWREENYGHEPYPAIAEILEWASEPEVPNFRLRKQGSIPNKIEVIELRSDPKYGGFFTHEPARAKVSFKRAGEKVEITIDDFISPTILERLKQQNKDNPLFQPQISDWRSMVDSVMIDTAYDGSVFNITLTDVPERKNDLVEGKYVVEAEKGATVAVKVTDMLGEEVLVVNEV